MLSFYSSIDRRKSIEPMVDNSEVGRGNKNEIKMNRRRKVKAEAKEKKLISGQHRFTC